MQLGDRKTFFFFNISRETRETSGMLISRTRKLSREALPQWMNLGGTCHR
jgi:hypothetical protein